MKFSEVVAQTLAWLQREGRVSYRALKREFDLDDEFLEDLKTEIIDAKRLAMDEEGKVLVWVGVPPVLSSESRVLSSKDKDQKQETRNDSPLSQDSALRTQHSSAERRQLTMLFCDLVGSTALSTRLDPEELRDLIRAYQQTCAEVIHRHEGYIAQYLGDGLLVYFGYPTAHEDDARRVRTGLEIVAALPRLNEQASATLVGARRRAPTDPATTPLLQVRIGIHTGLVVVGDIGARGRTEQLALGETPNIAARVQGLAEPNTVLISAATQRLVDSSFECQPFGSHFVKGLDAPIAVYRAALAADASAVSAFELHATEAEGADAAGVEGSG
ncbi:MAG: adenylate/guanylate cyclase domain-containing protein [Deltaproteobacteria bacterium]|nr:adenylate/guanylate cyclase domain-containing protein [Deltaproteobacteria bacterium]